MLFNNFKVSSLLYPIAQKNKPYSLPFKNLEFLSLQHFSIVFLMICSRYLSIIFSLINVWRNSCSNKEPSAHEASLILCALQSIADMAILTITNTHDSSAKNLSFPYSNKLFKNINKQPIENLCFLNISGTHAHICHVISLTVFVFFIKLLATDIISSSNSISTGCCKYWNKGINACSNCGINSGT